MDDKRGKMFVSLLRLKGGRRGEGWLHNMLNSVIVAGTSFSPLGGIQHTL